MTTSTTAEASSLRDFPGLLVLVGAGKMGEALLDGWLALGLDPGRVAVMEPQPSPKLAALMARGLDLNPAARRVKDPAVIVIAVKPQAAAEVLPGIAAFVCPSTLIVSIMAGQTLKSIEQPLPGGSAVVRAMPNTPAAIGRGITVAVPNGSVTPKQRDLAQRLLAAGGVVEWVADESWLDAVTAVSGSGPAYVFLLTETLARAGARAGLPADHAARLARATVAG
jgi:pyrroline-5-carboxylate reductase